MFTAFRFSPRRLRCAAAFLLLASPFAGRSAAPDQPNSSNTGATIASHRLRPMDLIRVQFYQESDMDRELRVSQDHKIVLPLVGPVDIKDRTVREAELHITELYRKDYLVNPQLNITILEYSQRTVTVLGAVNGPGAVVIPPERSMTLLDVIAKSGGFSRLANRKNISLTRNLPNGEPRNWKIDADLIMVGDAPNQWTVQDGDIITVPERLL